MLPYRSIRPLQGMITMLLLLISAFHLQAQNPSVDFKQSSNKNPGLGQIYWINSIVQQNNSVFYEGMAVPQRIIFRNLASGTHKLVLSHQSIKQSNSTHAYDFLTSWDQAIEAAAQIYPNSPLLAELIASRCGDALPGSFTSVCSDRGYSIRVDIVPPSSNPSPTFGSGSVADKKSAFDTYFAGDNRMQIFSNAPITSASISFLGYFGNDQDARYELTWTSTADNAIIEFAGHLASGNDFFGGTNIGWGIGKGCGAIAGAPYHINLEHLVSNGNVNSLGNQDNQVKGIDIRSCADLAAAATNVSCYGGSNGSVNLTVNGGVAPYTFLWSNGATTEDISGLTAGTYTVTVTDNTGCPSRTSIEITEPSAPLVASIGTPTHVKCYGGSDGSATASATGGTTAYSYSWNTTPAQTTATASGLSAGTYTVTVTDANGCTDSEQVTITQPTALVASIGTSTNVTCNSGSDGAATASASGGTGSYSYSWNTTPAQTTATATGLSAGVYTVTVTDDNGCTDTELVTITEPDELVVSIGTPTHVKCKGESNGSATASATGGTGSYSYSWNTTPVQTTATATGLAAGVYTVTVTDAHGCTDTEQVTISEPDELVVSIGTPMHVKCKGESNGSATASAVGGTTAYAYSWNTTPTQSTATASGLPAGTYTVTVTDANGCTDTEDVVITEPEVLVASIGTPTHVKCNGGSDGSATASATGGTTAYSYSWNTIPAQTTATASGLHAGTYTVTVTDANGCTDTEDVTISEPDELVASIGTPTPVTCNGGADGSATASAVGGTTAYSYSWNTTPAQTTATASGLPAGTYTVTVTDANGCTDTEDVVITQPSALVASIGTPTHVKCNGGSDGAATASATGGTGSYSYSWNTTPAQTTATASGLSAGTYTVTVTDANGCTDTEDVTISEPAVLVASIGTPTHVKCNGGSDGSVTASASGGTTVYSYSWNTTPAQSTATATGLPAGTYTVTVTDANGCTDTEDVTITEPDLLTLTVSSTTDIICKGESTGSISVSASGGNAGGFTYSINGTTFQAGSFFNSLKAGSYTITVKDSKGCTATTSATLTEGPVCYPYYTFSQGYYGNSGGKACIRETGLQATNAFMLAALSNGGTMVLGNGSSNRRFTVNATATEVTKLIAIMPGTTSASVLGNAQYTVYSIPTKNGKITNVLVGQTVAMWLNTRIPGNLLGGLDLIDADGKNYIVTRAVSNSSTCTEPFRASCSSNAGSLTNTLFPQAVINALKARKTATGKGTTVNDLVDFASEALGGGALYGTSLSSITSALDAIVNAFHTGRYFEQFSATAITCSSSVAPAYTRGGVQPAETTDVVKPEMPQDITVQAYPSPFIDQLNFRILSPVGGPAKLEVYNTMGQLLRTVFQGSVTAGVPVIASFESNRPQYGMLIFKFTVGNRSIIGKAFGSR